MMTKRKPAKPTSKTTAKNAAVSPAQPPKPLDKETVNRALMQVRAELWAASEEAEKAEKARSERAKEEKRLHPRDQSAIARKLSDVVNNLCAMHTLCDHGIITAEDTEELMTLFCDSVRSAARGIDACIAKLDPMAVHNCFADELE